MKYAYIRVSTAEQNEERQVEALKKYGIDKWYSEKVSAKDANRTNLKQLLEDVGEGDIVYIHEFSRLARNTMDLLTIVNDLEKKKVKLVSNKDDFDTSTARGRCMLTMLGAIAEFERALILERQREGIAIAKAKGVYKGRKRIEYQDVPHFEILYNKYLRRGLTKVQMAKQCKISRVVLDRLIAEYNADKKGENAND